MGELRDFARIEPHHVQLIRPVTVRKKRDALAVWRPDGRRVVARAGSQLAHTRTVNVNYPEVAAILVLDPVDPSAGENDLLPVGRNFRGADGFHIHKALFVEHARLRLGIRDGAEREQNRNDKQASGLHRCLHSCRKFSSEMRVEEAKRLQTASPRSLRRDHIKVGAYQLTIPRAARFSATRPDVAIFVVFSLDSMQLLMY